MGYNRTTKNMKKIITFSACALLVVGFMLSISSCTKDGVYTPKKQISAIYYQSSGGSKTLSEKWIWDGKLLDKIQYYGGQGITSTAIYKYDKKRLTEISTGSETIKFTYDGSKLSKVQIWYNSTLDMDIVVTHTKNKITKLDFTEYGSEYKSANNVIFHSLRGILPESTCENIPKVVEKFVQEGAKASSTWSMTYTYDGNNIKEEKYIYDAYEYIYTYKYDKEKNPFFNLLYGGYSYSDFELSQNNIIYVTEVNSFGDISEIEAIYTYEKSYPTEVMYRYITSGYTGGTTYYEYVK